MKNITLRDNLMIPKVYVMTASFNYFNITHEPRSLPLPWIRKKPDARTWAVANFSTVVAEFIQINPEFKSELILSCRCKASFLNKVIFSFHPQTYFKSIVTDIYSSWLQPQTMISIACITYHLYLLFLTKFILVLQMIKNYNFVYNFNLFS